MKHSYYLASFVLHVEENEHVIQKKKNMLKKMNMSYTHTNTKTNMNFSFTLMTYCVFAFPPEFQ